MCILSSEIGREKSAAVIGNTASIHVGQHVYALGAPQGLELTLSEGIVSSLRGSAGAPIVQTSAAISPGSSGGGLFDVNARLLGLTTSKVMGAEALGFAIPVEWIVELLSGPLKQASCCPSALSLTTWTASA